MEESKNIALTFLPAVFVVAGCLPHLDGWKQVIRCSTVHNLLLLFVAVERMSLQSLFLSLSFFDSSA